MSIVRIGATRKYAAQWEQAFGKKRTSKTGGAKQQAKKKSSGGSKKDMTKAGKAKKS